MTEQLFPRSPRRKKQPTAEMLREQLRLAATALIDQKRRYDRWLIFVALAAFLIGGVCGKAIS